MKTEVFHNSNQKLLENDEREMNRKQNENGKGNAKGRGEEGSWSGRS